MRITVIGGSGGTGAELVTAALADGHEVTVVSRGGRAPEGAAVVAGSATDLDVARRAVAGADAVVVTVGGTKGVPLSRTVEMQRRFHRRASMFHRTAHTSPLDGA